MVWVGWRDTRVTGRTRAQIGHRGGCLSGTSTQLLHKADRDDMCSSSLMTVSLRGLYSTGQLNSCSIWPVLLFCHFELAAVNRSLSTNTLSSDMHSWFLIKYLSHLIAPWHASLHCNFCRHFRLPISRTIHVTLSNYSPGMKDTNSHLYVIFFSLIRQDTMGKRSIAKLYHIFCKWNMMWSISPRASSQVFLIPSPGLFPY